jgi:hypothetical protein
MVVSTKSGPFDRRFIPNLRLEELWRIHPSLRTLKSDSVIQFGGFWYAERHHSEPKPPVVAPRYPFVSPQGSIDLYAVIGRGQRTCLPLVRESLLLKCGLKILFLRKEEAGRVYQGGDLDNRLKTLFDALSVPQIDQIPQNERGNSIGDPIHCLLEDDGLITAVSVETHRLLSQPSASKYQVHLVVGWEGLRRSLITAAQPACYPGGCRNSLNQHLSRTSPADGVRGMGWGQCRVPKYCCRDKTLRSPSRRPPRSASRTFLP